MREWIPISTSARGRLALAAVHEFGARPYESVTVGELARRAGVTTGALYHHYGSKLDLYTAVRTDVERRLLDRLEGAAAAVGGVEGAASAAMMVGFDFAVGHDFTRLLGDAAPDGGADAVANLFGQILGGESALTLGRILAAAWRAALSAVADGAPVGTARAALTAITPRVT